MKRTSPWPMLRIDATEPPFPLEMSSYTAQNVLVRGTNFPMAYAYSNGDSGETGDFLHSVYQDRAPEQWERAYRETLATTNGLRRCSDAEFLAFATALARQLGFTQPEPLTGARLVRFSNQGGYAIFRLDMWWKHPDTPRVECGAGPIHRQVARLHRVPLDDMLADRKYLLDEF